ncbi:MAG: pilus assembly protein PilB, partial [Ghiorsea sp.]|nr:pilus assembly protein PilB [Ghiorsea sp.]
MLLKQQRQLIDTGLVTQEQISEAMQSNEAKQGGVLLGLIALDGIDSNSILQALAKIYKVPY